MALRDALRKVRQGDQELDGTGLTEFVGKTRTQPERGASPRCYLQDDYLFLESCKVIQ